MSIFQKIQDIYFLYSSLDKNINLLKKFSKLSEITIKKYISIYENLDIRLFSFLDNPSKKLTLDIAFNFSTNVLNHDTQYKLFTEMFTKKTKENKIILKETSNCLICCEDSKYIFSTRCCDNFICEKCFFKTITMYLYDYTFKFVKCPLCNISFSINKIVKYLDNIIMNDYINNNKFISYLNFRNDKVFECKGLVVLSEFFIIVKFVFFDILFI